VEIMSPSKDLDLVATLQQRVTELEESVRRQTERAAAAENRFRIFMDAAPVMAWIAGPDGLCTYFNRAWLDFRGRTLEQETGNGWAEGIYPDDRSACFETILTSFSSRQPFRMQFRMMRAGGGYGWVELTGVPVSGADGAPAGFLGAGVDITDRKRGVFTPDEEAMRLVFALTERERQVLVLIAAGRSTKEAASQLGISYKTADSHRSRILEKLGVHETASMVRYAIRSGLIEP
jgi:PAS domain S-box-containing protein